MTPFFIFQIHQGFKTFEVAESSAKSNSRIFWLPVGGYFWAAIFNKVGSQQGWHLWKGKLGVRNFYTSTTKLRNLNSHTCTLVIIIKIKLFLIPCPQATFSLSSLRILTSMLWFMVKPLNFHCSYNIYLLSYIVYLFDMIDLSKQFLSQIAIIQRSTTWFLNFISNIKWCILTAIRNC